MTLGDPITEFQGKYRFLSNFWPSPITFVAIEYPTVEHAFQAAKTLDRQSRLDIARLDTPGQAKRAGRHVVLRDNWDDIKVLTMSALIALKFRDPTLQALLQATGTRWLEEGNTWGDTFWGVCRGEGQNKLGNLLMAERATHRLNNPG